VSFDSHKISGGSSGAHASIRARVSRSEQICGDALGVRPHGELALLVGDPVPRNVAALTQPRDGVDDVLFAGRPSDAAAAVAAPVGRARLHRLAALLELVEDEPDRRGELAGGGVAQELGVDDLARALGLSPDPPLG
jgi:hypothetical protein